MPVRPLCVGDLVQPRADPSKQCEQWADELRRAPRDGSDCIRLTHGAAERLAKLLEKMGDGAVDPDAYDYSDGVEIDEAVVRWIVERMSALVRTEKKTREQSILICTTEAKQSPWEKRA